MQMATQPLEAPGAGTATQPVQAPGSGPDVQPTGEGDLSAASDIEADQLSVTGSLDDEIHRDRSPDRDVPRDETDQEPTEEANYRETMRSFMNWHKIPEFETVSSTADDNPFAGARVQPTGKVSVKQDTVNALRTSPVHLNALFPDQLITKAEEEISRSEERRSSGTSHRHQGRFHPYAARDKSTGHHDRKNLPAWKQIKDEQQARKSRGKASTFSQKPAKGSKSHK